MKIRIRMPIIAAAAIALLVLWFIIMNLLALYLLFGGK